MNTPHTRRIGIRLALWLAGLLALSPARAGTTPERFDYALTPQQVAPDTWLLQGRAEDFSRENGGNIVNTAFIATGDGVIVIDSGPTRRYGEQLRAAIARVTAEPVREVWLTHHHPDHALGNQAFAATPIRALPATGLALAREGPAFVDNVYRLTGDWAKGTALLAAADVLATGERTVGRHRFRVLALGGHTAGDAVILDETTGVLFAGDLVFHDRAPTTPHADLATWLTALERIEQLPFATLVPGHGAPTAGADRLRPLAQTRSWLTWLDALFQDAARRGLDPTEVGTTPLPPELAHLPLARHELIRSLAHLFRTLEARALTGTGAR